MKRSWLIGGILILLAIITGGFFIWKIFSNKPEASTILSQETQKTITKIVEPTYPKAKKYDVPILMYHYIRNAEDESELGKNLSVSPDNFQKQIEWLKNDGYQTLKLVDLADPEKKALSKLIYEKKKPIIITFDDGYTDAYTQAFPVLKNYGFIGTFFIIKNYIGKDFYMNQAQIDEIQNAGMEFGSHSLSHINLETASSEDSRGQISQSKNNWETFCYPSGKYSEETVTLVKEAGYMAAVTTKFGIANQDSNLFELRRVRIENGSAETLKEKIEAAYAQTPI